MNVISAVSLTYDGNTAFRIDLLRSKKELNQMTQILRDQQVFVWWFVFYMFFFVVVVGLFVLVFF